MNEKIRFVLVGIANTAVDFSVLFLLSIGLGLAPFLANIVSTTTALIVSFGLNKRTVFRDTGTHHVRQFTIFIIVTLIGIWGLQGVVIWAIDVAAVSLFNMHGPIVLLVAKLAASAFSTVWNYVMYSRVVFTQQNIGKK